jgi:hypothetical protein
MHDKARALGDQRRVFESVESLKARLYAGNQEKVIVITGASSEAFCSFPERHLLSI